MEYLCRKAGLKIESIHYNSQVSQFISSLLYQRGIPYVEQGEEAIRNMFTKKEVDEFVGLTAELNQKGYGDHAVFVVVK